MLNCSNWWMFYQHIYLSCCLCFSLSCSIHHAMWSKIHNVWEKLRTIEFGRKIFDSSGIFHIYILILLLLLDFFSVLNLTPLHTLFPLTYNHASASTTMDGVPAVPNLHTDIWRDCSPAHQLGLWTYCLQDVPEQVTPKGLSLWPDSHQHRHRAATCQYSPVAAGGRPGKSVCALTWLLKADVLCWYFLILACDDRTVFWGCVLFLKIGPFKTSFLWWQCNFFCNHSLWTVQGYYARAATWCT